MGPAEQALVPLGLQPPEPRCPSPVCPVPPLPPGHLQPASVLIQRWPQPELLLLQVRPPASVWRTRS